MKIETFIWCSKRTLILLCKKYFLLRVFWNAFLCGKRIYIYKVYYEKKIIKENEQIENELNLSYDGKRITRRISFPHIAIAIYSKIFYFLRLIWKRRKLDWKTTFWGRFESRNRNRSLRVVRNLNRQPRRLYRRLSILLEYWVLQSEQCLLSGLSFSWMGITSLWITRILPLRWWTSCQWSKNFGPWHQSSSVVRSLTYQGRFQLTMTKWKTTRITEPFSLLNKENFSRFFN